MNHKEFLNVKRGIRDDVLATWNVSISDDCIKFKYLNGEKIRRNLPDEGRSFSFTGTSSLYKLDEPLKPTTIICEGETDTLRLYQELLDQGKLELVSVVGLSGLNGYKEEYAVEFADVKNVLVLLDNDPGYKERDTADLTYRKIRDTIGSSKVRRVRWRTGVKDVCTFFEQYSWESFKSLISPDNSAFHYKRLDLTKTPSPYKWLMGEWIAQGDVTLLLGEANVGKSFISMGLAIAVAEGKDTFLGEKLFTSGKVLYIDEENPEDVVYQRLTAMGLTAEGMKNIHYYHRQHIRVDRGIQDLMDDALTISPKLIIIDSMTRVHSQAENDSGAMHKLFNEGIIPLARETGAAVVVLHHTGKTESNNSYTRSRGSSDIGAAIDTGIECRKIVEATLLGEVKAVNMVHYKSRRKETGSSIKLQIADTLTGDIELIRLNEHGNF